MTDTHDNDALVRTVSRAIHEHLSRRDIMQYLDNDEDCEGLARHRIAALRQTDAPASSVEDMRERCAKVAGDVARGARLVLDTEKSRAVHEAVVGTASLIEQGIAALPTNTTAQVAESEDRYLILKGGAYYRPNAQGYTRNRAEAGRYTLAEAISHSHPNGPDGPRDGIRYEPVNAPAAPTEAEANHASQPTEARAGTAQ